MGGTSLIHWIILGIVVLLLFGGNRFSSMMGDVAKGLKSFKKGLADEDEDKAARPAETRQIPPSQPIDITPRVQDPAAPPPPGSDDPRR